MITKNMIIAKEAKEKTEEIIFKTLKMLDVINLEIKKAIDEGSYYANIELAITDFKETDYEIHNKIQIIMNNVQKKLNENGYECRRYIPSYSNNKEFPIKMVIHWDKD